MFKRKTVKPSASISHSDTATSYAPNLKQPSNHHISIKVVFISLLFLIPLLCMISYSAWATAEGNVFLEVPGIDIEYGGYDTCEMVRRRRTRLLRRTRQRILPKREYIQKQI